MNDADKIAVRNFCKSMSIKDKSLDNLAKIFLEKHEMSREDFELCMLQLGKSPALKVKEQCREYFRNEREFGYFKYCKEQTPITERFWEACIAGFEIPAEESEVEAPVEDAPLLDEKSSDAFSKLLPANWVKMDKAERLDFVGKIHHPGFRSYVLEKEPELKKYFSSKRSSINKMKLYVTLFQFPAENYSEEAKALLRCFVENLNSLGRSNLQFVECSNPHVIEIREVR
jgi:hypothetical protein